MCKNHNDEMDFLILDLMEKHGCRQEIIHNLNTSPKGKTLKYKTFNAMCFALGHYMFLLRILQYPIHSGYLMLREGNNVKLVGIREYYFK